MKKEFDQVSRFLLVGCLIFVVDGLVLFKLINVFSLPPLVSRIVSCSVALMTAFYLHARFTFLVSPSRGTLFRYLVSQSIGAGLNFWVYAVWLEYGYSYQAPLIGLTIGSVSATIFNYFVNKYFVYR